MAPRSTRSKPTPATPSQERPTAKLARNEDEQRRLFILPRDASSASRIISLPNPATTALGRYFFCPEKGLYEFSKIGASQNMPQSWLIAGQRKAESETQPDPEISKDESTSRDMLASSLHDGYVLQNADLFVATPIDPLFFLIPLFRPLLSGGKRSFRLGDDYIDVLSESSMELKLLLRQEPFQIILFKRLKSLSSTQELGDDCLYKPDIQLLVQEIVQKARRMTEPGTWPLSMQEAFVKKQLEIPISSVAHANPQLPTPEQSMTEADTDSGDSQSQITLLLDTSTTTKQPDQPGHALDSQPSLISGHVEELMRIRVALNYILSSYIPLSLREPLNQLLSSNDTIDFAPLDAHLAEVQRVKAEVQALRSLSDNISRKRGAADDDEAAEARAEKKQRKEEEEKRKKAESRASKQLKKVDTSGMKKLSSFFTKPTTATKE